MSSRALRRRSAYRAINGHQRDKPRPLLRIALVLLVGFMMLTSGASAATLFFYGSSLPTLKNFKHRFNFENTRILDKNGGLLYNLADLSKTRGRRQVEPLYMPGQTEQYYQQHHDDWLTADPQKGIPLALQNATIATEDATFYNNFGFDPLSIARAGYDNVTKGHVVSGASTITQQLIKQYILSDKATVGRKLEEVILAAELTQKYPKSKILWYYLNSVPYGNQAIGGEAAAKTYFNKDVWNLDPAECAFLAGLPEAPTTYNPVNNRQAAMARMGQVLHLMYIHGYLRDAKGNPDLGLRAQYLREIDTKYPRFSPPVEIHRFPHFVQYAIQQLAGLAQPGTPLYNKLYDGLDVYTTIDPVLQQKAEAIVQHQISQLGAYNVSDGALVSMDLDRTGPDACYGCIRAMVGSAFYNQPGGQINMADSPRQPGSSFKPFTYVYAFENGLGPASAVDDAPISIPDVGNAADGGVYQPQDYDKTWHGLVTLRTALQNSLNIPAVKVEQYDAAVGGNLRDTVLKTAYDMGIKSIISDNPNCCGWALTLGGMERGVRLVEETAAYGAFGSGGHVVPPIAVRRVVDRATGKVLYDADTTMNDAFRQTPITPAAAYVVTNVLSDNVSRCTPIVCEFGLTSPLFLGRPAAAKTGTTNGYTDNWTVGYTPDLVTGVWVGNADNSQMVNTSGVTGAAPIWHDFMLAALSTLNIPPKDFPQPPVGVEYGSACQEPSGYGGTYFSSFGEDLFTGKVPYCNVDSGAAASGAVSNAPAIPTQPPAYTPPQTNVQQPAPQTNLAPTAAAAPTQSVSPPTSPPAPPVATAPSQPTVVLAPAAPTVPAAPPPTTAAPPATQPSSQAP